MTTTALDRGFFLDTACTALFDGRLSGRQSAGLTALLDRWCAAHARADDRWLAYILGTVHHETDRAMQPVREYGRGRGLPYGVPDPATGHVFYGRGLIQITHKENYRKLSRVVGFDLVHDPDAALDLDVAISILFQGMIGGLFTGKRLSDFFDEARNDWRGARRIVNGFDRASLVASYGRAYYAAISYRTARAA